MEPTPKALKKKWWKRALWVLLALIGIPVVLVGAALIFIQTGAGSALIKKQALSILGNTLQGKLDFDDVQLSGGHVVLTNAKLFTPEGELVASIEKVDLWVDLPALTRKTVKVTSVTISTPKVMLKSDERGLNLLRALAVKNPKPDDGKSTPVTWTIDIDALKLTDGFFDFELPDRRITAGALAIDGETKINLSPFGMGGAVSLTADVTSPLEKKLVLKTTASAASGPQTYDFDLTLGKTLARGKLEIDPLAVTLAELVADPEELNAFIPGWPIKPAIIAKGTASLSQANLDVRAGKAALLVAGKYDIEKSSAEDLSVKATGVDLKELLGAELTSNISATVTGAIADWRPDTLTGNVDVDAAWDAKGNRLASVNAKARATQGTLSFDPLTVISPGIEVRASGTASLKQADLEANVNATDLSKLGVTLKRFANIDVGGLGGSGSLHASLHGPIPHLTAKITGTMQRLSIATVRATSIDLDSDIPDILKPLETDTLIHAKQLAIGDRAFDEVTLDFYSAGRKLDLDLSTKGLGDLKVNLIGRIDDDSMGADVDQMHITWTGSAWELESPFSAKWRDGRIEVFPFAIHEGASRIAGQLLMVNNTIDAEAHVVGFDLTKLPNSLISPEWKLGGIIDAVDAKVTGRTSNPEIQAKVALRDATAFGITNINAAVDASYIDSRAKGSLKVTSGVGAIDGTFDVPVLAVLQQKPGATTARITLSNIDTATLEQQLDVKLPVKGTATGLIEVSGDARAPQLVVTVNTPLLEVRLSKEDETEVLPLTGLTLVARTDEAGALGATIDVRALGGTHHVALSTPLTLASLRSKVPDKDALLAMNAKLELELKEVLLKDVGKTFKLNDDELAGSVTLSGTINGPARAPTGELTLALGGVTYPPIRNASGEFAFRAKDAEVTVTGHAEVDKKPAIELTAAVKSSLQRPLAVLFGSEANADAILATMQNVPLELQLQVRPFDIGTAVKKEDKEASPGGKLTADLTVKGTLEQPDVKLKGMVSELRFDKVALGQAEFDVSSTGTAQKFEVVFGNDEGRDDMHITGTTGLQLHLSALRKGLEWKTAKVDLVAKARQFDVSFLSGISDVVRQVGGSLDLDATVKDTLGSPQLIGDVKLHEGRLSLAGFGEYNHLEVDLHATNTLVELKKLDVQSGGGKASITARADRQASGAYVLKSNATIEKFPIVVDDQLLATGTLRYELDGEATSKLINIKRLSLPRVDVDLPEVKRKDLQDLQRAGDIIVLRNGMTLTQRRKKEAQQKAGTGGGLAIRLVIDAPRNIWVRSTDVNVEAGLSDGFRVEVDESTRLTGEVRVVRGKLTVIGRAFEIQSNSSVRFNGAPTEPYINAAALHVNEKEQIKITVSVAGKLPDLNIKATSEPPMSESDIYAVLATGRRNLQAGGGAAITPGAAASVVGQLATSQLKTAITKKLPLDVFNFETSDKFDRVKFDVGKYLSDTVYVGYTANIGAKRERGENINAGRLEWQMTRSVSLEVYAGDALAFGADAVWTRDF